ncbi:MAG: tail fiber domain-containing protein, partial [Bacteroidetes bacterium]|nr:tail fiber domain-containing protein [Bacteroidota bacterium]
LGNTSGNQNVAIGNNALNANSSGSNNIAIGYESMLNATASELNVAIGNNTLRAFNNTNASTGRNTAVGYNAMRATTSGSYNTAMGYNALDANTTGQLNVSIGYNSMPSSTSASNNIGIGYNSLQSLSSGSENTAVGYQSMYSINTGTLNTSIGYQAGPTWGTSNLTNTTSLGNSAVATANNQVRIGNTAVTSIGGFANWTNISDGRYKINIKENIPGLEFVMKLKPISYNFDFVKLDVALKPAGENVKQLGNSNPNAGTRYSGFVAQEVEKAANEVGYDFSGVDKAKTENDLYGLRYSEFVVPMVKAIQEQQFQIDALKKQNLELMRVIGEIQANKK